MKKTEMCISNIIKLHCSDNDHEYKLEKDIAHVPSQKNTHKMRARKSEHPRKGIHVFTCL